MVKLIDVEIGNKIGELDRKLKEEENRIITDHIETMKKYEDISNGNNYVKVMSQIATDFKALEHITIVRETLRNLLSYGTPMDDLIRRLELGVYGI